MIAELGSHQGQREERIYRAVALDPALFESALAEQVAVRDELEWDEREGVLRAERQRRVGELVLSREPLPTLDEEARGKALLALVRRKGLELLAGRRSCASGRRALACCASSSWMRATPATGRMSATPHCWHARRTGCCLIWARSRGWRTSPSSISPRCSPPCCPGRCRSAGGAGTGGRHGALRLAHPAGLQRAAAGAGGAPAGAVRHGRHAAYRRWPAGRQAAPAVAGAPAGTGHPGPASFWANTYAEVKKDLKGRYPKHYWPDDPLIAEPTARAKPRGQ